jgi:5-aminopentanamidase
MRSAVRIGACQTPDILGDVEAAVSCIKGFCEQARREGADLLLFPECFLQGYLVTEAHARRHALDLGSAEFRSVAARLADVAPVLVTGVIERSGSRLYNSAVVLEHGQVAGVYRKTHLTPGETLFDKGEQYPVFEVKGVRYGINICYDTQFADAAARIAGQRARVLLVPAQNMMRRQAAEAWKQRHNQIRAERVRQTGMWLVSADVTGERGDTHIGYGPTSVMNPSADMVAQVPLMETGMVIAQVPAQQRHSG